MGKQTRNHVVVMTGSRMPFGRVLESRGKRVESAYHPAICMVTP